MSKSKPLPRMSAPRQPGPARHPGLPLQDAGRALVFRPDEDDPVACALGKGREGHALDQKMRVGVDQDPVLERAGLHLVGVAHQVARVGGAFGHAHQFAPGGEGGAAAALEHGLQDLLAHRPG
jgi:hypothetical protein